MARLNVNGWDEERALKAVKEAVDSNNRHNIWLYYSLAYAHFVRLGDYDKFSFAGLLTSIITCWHGEFGTEEYDKERKIEERWQFIENTLIEMGWRAQGIAVIAVTFLEDQYRKSMEDFAGDEEPAGIYRQSIPE